MSAFRLYYILIAFLQFIKDLLMLE